MEHIWSPPAFIESKPYKPGISKAIDAHHTPTMIHLLLFLNTIDLKGNTTATKRSKVMKIKVNTKAKVKMGGRVNID
jgi:hypothetical protein